MNTLLDAYLVKGLGGKKGEENKCEDDECNPPVETVEARICQCALCGKKERIVSEDVTWLSMDEAFQAVKEGKILSDNPEVELLFKMIETLLKK